MNVLPLAKRAQIVTLKAEGATLREIARRVGVCRETVATYVGRNTKRRHALLAAVDRAFEVLDASGDYGAMFDALISIDALVRYHCPLHPDATIADMLDEDVAGEGACRLCRSDGLRRHHVRRKAEGRPVVPPRRTK